MTTTPRTLLRFGPSAVASPAVMAGLITADQSPDHGFLAGAVVFLLLAVLPVRGSFSQRARSIISRIALAMIGLGLAWAPLDDWVRTGALAAVAGLAWVVVSEFIKNRLAASDREPTLIVGEAEVVMGTIRMFNSYPAFNVMPVATATPDGLQPSVLPGGSIEDVPALIEEHGIKHVINVSAEYAPKLERIIGRDRAFGVRLSALQPLGEILTGRVDVVSVRGLPFMSLAPRRPAAGPAWAAKRAIDYVVSIIGLVALSPVFAVAAIAIKLDTRGPVFFRQERVGRNGKPFDVWKFRSMVPGAETMLGDIAHLNEADGAYFKIECDPRATRVGRVLRRLSIDELPQLFNVIRGEMSLVGPRPFLAAEMEEDPETFEWRKDFLPGITGIWQIAGRSWLPRLEGMRMDLAYIEHWSVALDLRIMWSTLRVAIQGDRRPSYEHLHPVPDSRSRVARVIKPRPRPHRAAAPAIVDGTSAPS